MNALISECGAYRYYLTRETGLLNPKKDRLVFVLLNPSTADAFNDDPTVRRCLSFASRWEYAEMVILNLYAYRATDPKRLFYVDNPVGPDNDMYIKKFIPYTDHIVCAWGNHAKEDRIKEFMEITKGKFLTCFGTTKQGAPKHPLYIRSDRKLDYFDRPHE